MGYHERGMETNLDKYGYDDGAGFPTNKREEDLHIRNVAVGGFKIPSDVLET